MEYHQDGKFDALILSPVYKAGGTEKKKKKETHFAQNKSSDKCPINVRLVRSPNHRVEFLSAPLHPI